RQDAATLNRAFLQWLDRTEPRPFFAFLNYMDVHDPYCAPQAFASHFSSEALPRPEAARAEAGVSEDVLKEQNVYDCCLASLDGQLGLLSGELEGRSSLENTLVFLTADHGEQFGEHGLPGHGNSLYLPVVHVPLQIVFPSHVPAGERIAEPVSL